MVMKGDSKEQALGGSGRHPTIPGKFKGMDMRGACENPGMADRHQEFGGYAPGDGSKRRDVVLQERPARARGARLAKAIRTFLSRPPWRARRTGLLSKARWKSASDMA